MHRLGWARCWVNVDIASSYLDTLHTDMIMLLNIAQVLLWIWILNKQVLNLKCTGRRLQWSALKYSYSIVVSAHTLHCCSSLFICLNCSKQYIYRCAILHFTERSTERYTALLDTNDTNLSTAFVKQTTATSDMKQRFKFRWFSFVPTWESPYRTIH